MRGRKPDTNAARRAKDKVDLAAATKIAAPVISEASIIEPTGPVKPPEIAANENLSALWDLYAGDSLSYRPEDGPIIAQMVFELETARQCRQNCMDDYGVIHAVVGRGEPDPVTGMYPDSVVNPWYKAMGEAQQRALKLADQLGATPLARARLGLTQAAGAAVAVSIADQVKAAVDRMGK